MTIAVIFFSDSLTRLILFDIIDSNEVLRKSDIFRFLLKKIILTAFFTFKHSRLISFRIDWFDLLAVQQTTCYPFFRASLITQLVKNLPAMQETPV